MSDGRESIDVDVTAAESLNAGRSGVTAQQRRMMIASLVGGHWLLSLWMPSQMNHEPIHAWMFAFALGICIG